MARIAVAATAPFGADVLERLASRHEVVTVLQRIDLADRLELEEADELRVSGFEDDTLVQRALSTLASETNKRWHVRIDKHIPVAAGLGGGSSNAATADQRAYFAASLRFMSSVKQNFGGVYRRWNVRSETAVH